MYNTIIHISLHHKRDCIMNIEFLSKEHDAKNEQTAYFFEVTKNDGETEEYGLYERNGEFFLYDYEGYPIDECNDHDRVKEKLEQCWEDLTHELDWVYNY